MRHQGRRPGLCFVSVRLRISRSARFSYFSVRSLRARRIRMITFDTVLYVLAHVCAPTHVLGAWIHVTSLIECLKLSQDLP